MIPFLNRLRRVTTISSPRKRLRGQRAQKNRMGCESLETRVLLSAITGTIYDDVDSSGTKTNKDNTLGGWQVYVDLDNSGTLNNRVDGTPEPSALANSGGDYTINMNGLPTGTYRVTEIVQPGWSPTAPTSRDVAFTSGQDSNKIDFFNFAGGDIVGTVWNDINADGIRAVDPLTGEFTDPGLEGWTVFIDMKPAGGGGLNGIPDPGEPITTTDASGQYHFSNLPAGDYEVTEVQPTGWDIPPGKWDTKQTVAVKALTTATQDYANFSLINGSINGSVWNDVNIDGVRNTDPLTGDFTEPGLADWTIFLDTNNNGVLDPTEMSTITDADGNYSFISLAAGDYEVTEELPAGWDVSPLYDSRQTVAVRGGRSSSANDFANFTVENGSISGTVWNDLFRDGVRNSDLSGAYTDPGIAGWTVYLDMNRNGAFDSTEPTAITDANGQYLFPNLQVGEYEVIEIVPTGWETAPTFGDNYTVRVYSGAESVAHDFANFNLSTLIPGTVSGTVWNDVNANGVIDSTPTVEPGLGGRIVFADVNSNGILDSSEPQATTNADGTYTIAGVSPGTVSIVDVLPAGWRATSPITSVRSVVLKNGENKTGINYGNVELKNSTISGAVFADTNKNGVRDAGEHGLAGITVYLDLNNSGTLDAGDVQTTTSADLYYTPSVNEAGNYSFDHLASGTYSVRQIIPVELSATPSTQFEHSVTMVAAENYSSVDFADVFRLNEIHGVKFDDANGNHVRDADEKTVAGTTIFIDSNRNNVLDADEASTITGSDGSYSFTGLTPGAYVVREVVESGYGITFPTTSGGILWPTGVSNPAVGNVSPTSITTSLMVGQSYTQTVSLTLPNTGALTNAVDVFLLFDDTGSFTNNSPIVRAAFPNIITQLQTSLSGTDLAFGVGRFEEYGNFASEYGTGRPFVLNQPIVAASTPGYMTAIQAALNRTTPGYGGDGPETDIEALYQLVTGIGFDGNNNGSVMDSGAAGLGSTQLLPGNSGDVPSFASFTADASAGVLPAAGTVGGGGFRAGALPVILLATDIGFAYQPKGETSITGANGLTLPVSDLTGTSRASTPFNSGAGLQETITGLNALGALVIGLGTNTQSNVDPRQGLEAISKLTGAINRSTGSIDNGTGTPIAPGDPLYFQISSGFAGSVAAGVQNAIQNAVTNVAMNITVQASDPRVKIINHTGTRAGIGSGQTASFDIEFIGDGIPHRFDLQFVREGTNVVLGSIPVVLGTPIPGDGYHFDDLDEGEIELEDHFGDYASGTTASNVAPSFVGGDNQVAPEDAGTQTVTPWATSISPGPATEASQAVNFVVVSNDNPSLFSVQPTISADGILTFTSAPDAFGTATLSVVLQDNGGTANGGVDTSAPQAFTINITAVNDAPTGTAAIAGVTTEGQILTADVSGVADADGVGKFSYLWSNGATTSSITLGNSDVGTEIAVTASYTDGNGTLETLISAAVGPVANVNNIPTGTVLIIGIATEDEILTADVSGLADADGLGAFTYLWSTGATTSLITLGNSDVGQNISVTVSYTDGHGTPELLTSAAVGPVANVNDIPIGTVLITGIATEGEILTADVSGLADADGLGAFSYLWSTGATTSSITLGNSDVGQNITVTVSYIDSHGTVESLTSAAVGPVANVNNIPTGTVLITGIATEDEVLTANVSGIADADGLGAFGYLWSTGATTSSITLGNANVGQNITVTVSYIDGHGTVESLTSAAVGPIANVNNIPTGTVLVTGVATEGEILTADVSGIADADGLGAFSYLWSTGATTSSITLGNADVGQNITVTVRYVDGHGTVESLTSAAVGPVANVNNIPTGTVLITGIATEGEVLTANVSGIADADGLGAFSYLWSTGATTSSITLGNSDVGQNITVTASYVDGHGTPESLTSAIVGPVAKMSDAPMGDVHFLVVDKSSRRTFEYDSAGSMLANPRLNTEDQGPMGVAVSSDGSLRWVVDSKGEVFVYNDRNTLLGSWEIGSVDKAQGITVNGSDLLIVDSSNDRVYVFAGATDRRSGKASPSSSFALNRANRNATDLMTDGNHIWVVNATASADQVFRYSMTGKLEGSWTIDPANTNPTGITLAPGTSGDIWIVDSLTDQAYGYIGAAELTSGSAAADRQFALNSLDGNAQGIAAVISPAPTTTSSSAVITPASAGKAVSIFADTSETPVTPVVTTDGEDDDLAESPEKVENDDSHWMVSTSSASSTMSSKHTDDSLDDLLLDEAFASDDLFLLFGR